MLEADDFLPHSTYMYMNVLADQQATSPIMLPLFPSILIITQLLPRYFYYVDVDVHACMIVVLFFCTLIGST